MIEFDRVSKSFGAQCVLNRLSFRVPEGATYALLGLSGSGKTTALKIIAGLQLPDEGTLRIEGEQLSESTVSNIRSKIGYVIQDGGLFPHLTAKENLELVGSQANWPTDKTEARIFELADLAQLPRELLTKFPRQLSGGQRQRVGLIRALMKNPPILLLDEPLGALDPITRSDLQKELRSLCRQLKKTVLLVTHDLYEAGFMADRILLLNSGEVIQQGQLTDLIQNPATDFVKRFVSSQVHSVGL